MNDTLRKQIADLLPETGPMHQAACMESGGVAPEWLAR